MYYQIEHREAKTNSTMQENDRKNDPKMNPLECEKLEK